MSQCKAKSKRSQVQCLKWAVRGKETCRMHGAKSKGPKTRKGRELSKLAALKHGRYTKKSLQENREIRELIRLSQNTLRSIDL